MRIAQIAPLAERVPPKKYGGTERVVSVLTDELVRRGHEVTLFASGDSITTAKLHAVYPRSLREAKLKDIYALNYWLLLNIGSAYAMQDQFDIIHDHLTPISLPTAHLAKTPVVMTMHGPFTTENRRIFRVLNKPHIVSISNSQAFTVPNINHAGTVYNGLNMSDYPFGDSHEDYLLFVGRISMEKGTHFAIDVAQELDKELIIAAKLDKSDEAYFKEYIEWQLSDRIRWIGEVDDSERNLLMSKALCMLHPVTWREPFGLTMIEAMACGCPVAAFNHGSIPEIVKTGETGFVVEDLETMIEAIENIHKIDRSSCRRYALENFSGEKMADNYEKLYEKLIQY